MVLPHVLLRVLPELVVVLALDDVATDARDLLHALIVSGKDPNTKQPLLQAQKARRKARERCERDHRLPNDRKEQRYVMATFAVIAEHPPDLCPTSNAKTRQMLKEGASQIPQLAEQLGVDIGTLRIFGPDHVILVVVEADDINSVRHFALQSGLMQWNTVKIHATYSIGEAVAMVDEVEAIF
jgi:hypothetical protein